MVQVDVITDYAGFAALQENWDQLYTADPEAHLFLSWQWVAHTFLRKPDRRYFILAVKASQADPNYVAFFPLRFSKRKRSGSNKSFNLLTMAGNYWADYTGFLCHPAHESLAIPALAAKLQTLRWAVLKLEFIHHSKRRLAPLLSAFPTEGFSIREHDRHCPDTHVDSLVCPYVALPGSFQAYLSENMSANSRQKLRRHLKKIDSDQDFSITHITDRTRDRDLDILAGFWVQKWRPYKGSKTDRLAQSYKQFLSWGMDNNCLHMPILWHRERPLAALGSFVDWQKKSLLFFVAGRDESYRDRPAGFILHGHSIRWAIDNKLQIYDFLSGNEAYKYSFGVLERHIHCLHITTRSGGNIIDGIDPFARPTAA